MRYTESNIRTPSHLLLGILNNARTIALIAQISFGVFSVAIGEDFHVILSGGPGLYDSRDPEHDSSWGNYVTKPLIDLQHHPMISTTYWLIYRPAYDARWRTDVATRGRQQLETERVRRIHPTIKSYTDLLEYRAKQRAWRLIWINSEAGFWQQMLAMQPTIKSFRYYGHASGDLWLQLEHNTNGDAVAPDSHAIVRIADISRHLSKNEHLFHEVSDKDSTPVNKGESYFYGCNTDSFAEIWALNFRTIAFGIAGKMDFATMQHNDIQARKGYSDAQVRSFDYSPEKEPRLTSMTIE